MNDDDFNQHPQPQGRFRVSLIFFPPQWGTADAEIKTAPAVLVVAQGFKCSSFFLKKKKN